MRPSLRGRAKGLIAAIDRPVSRLSAKVERRGLLAFLFHNIFPGRSEADSGAVAPHERATEADVITLIEYFLECGYSFVSAEEVRSGLVPGRQYAHLTLDDGYASNRALVERLRPYKVPVTIFVSTRHVEEGKAFWWDVLYRERNRRGQGGSIEAETEYVQTMPHDAIDRYLVAEFGPNALHPTGEIDRPMRRDELFEVARQPGVTLGIHTMDHAILTNHSPAESERQIRSNQEYLGQVVGKPPWYISYPNGRYDDAIIALASRCDLEMGITVEPRKNRLPLNARSAMTLGRFVPVVGPQFLDQLRVMRSDLRIGDRITLFRHRQRRG